MVRSSQDRTAGLVPVRPVDAETEGSEDPIEPQRLASVQSLFPDGVAPPSEPAADLDGDDDDVADLDDVSDDDFYAAAFEMIE